MNPWLIAAGVLMVGLLPCLVVCARAAPIDRLIAFELATVIETMTFLLLAQGLKQDTFFDLAVVMALLSLAGGLVFVHFMERWV